MRPSPLPSSSCSSLIPWLMALRESPVARETAEIPPHPRASASLAATNRLARSFSLPATCSNLRLIAASSFMPHSLSHLLLRPLFIDDSLAFWEEQLPEVAQQVED